MHALRDQQGLGTRSYAASDIVIPACGVSHRRLGKGFRPELPRYVQRVKLMIMIAIDKIESVEPWCSYCQSVVDVNECFLCTKRLCGACRQLSAELAGFEPQDSSVRDLLPPALL